MENEPPRPPSRSSARQNNSRPPNPPPGPPPPINNNNTAQQAHSVVNQAVARISQTLVARISQTDARDALARRTSSAISVASSMGDAGPDPVQTRRTASRVLSAESTTSDFSAFSEDSNDSTDLMTIALLNNNLSSISNQSLSSSIISRIGDHKFFEWRETYSSWKKFDEYRKQKLFTDVDLVVDGQSFSCHKAVLCASCRYKKFEKLVILDRKLKKRSKTPLNHPETPLKHPKITFFKLFSFISKHYSAESGKTVLVTVQQ